jgi:hypothetical protein
MFMNSTKYGHVKYQIEALDEPDSVRPFLVPKFGQFSRQVQKVIQYIKVKLSTSPI